MVKLIVDDSEQITMLEYALTSAGIDYELIISDGEYGIKPPHLVLHGVPIDELRSFKWLEEHIKASRNSSN